MSKKLGSGTGIRCVWMLGLAFLCSGYTIPASRAESGQVANEVTKVDRLGPSRYETRVRVERSGSLGFAREEALRAIRYAAAESSEELVSVSRTLAGNDYRERVRTLSAVGVSVRVVSETIRAEAGGRILDLVADVTVDPASGDRLRSAVEQDVQRGAKLRALEAEVARLNGVIAGLPAGKGLAGSESAKRKAALEALLQNESAIRQIFPAGGFESMLAEGDAVVEAALQMFDREVLFSLINTYVDARIIRAEPFHYEKDRALRGVGRAGPESEWLIAPMKIEWTTEEPLAHYAKVLSRWFAVHGARATSDYSIIPTGFSPGGEAVCVRPGDARNPYVDADELFSRMRDRRVTAAVGVWDAEGVAEDRPVGKVQGVIAGLVDSGRWWCIFELKPGAKALPSSGTPGIYADSYGAAISSALPYRLRVPRVRADAITHVTAEVRVSASR